MAFGTAGADSVAQPNYPRNAWWVAALAAEIARAPYGCWLLDRPILLYRTESGAVTALDNRCPHRWAPLSQGKLVDDTIECRYHGFRFGPDGRGVSIPSQTHVPGACSVHCYPVQEKNGFVWIWMGDHDRMADAPAPPEMPWLDDADWTTIHGHSDINCNYMLLQENVLDLTHFGFLHAASLGVTDWVAPPIVEVKDSTVEFTQTFESRALHEGFAATFGLPTGLNTRYVSQGRYLPPSVHEATETVTLPEPVAGRQTFHMKILHVTSPMSMGKFRYYWFYGWDAKVPEPVLDGWRKMAPVFWAEDQDMIEAIDDIVRNDSRATDCIEVSVKADTAAIQARRVLRAMLASN